MKKKICILQNDLTFGGTDTFVINLCKGLVNDGYNVTVVLSVDEQKEIIREKELFEMGVTTVRTCSLQSGITSKLKHLQLLYKELRKGHYDVFQTNIDLFNGPQMLVAWLARVPIRVCHSHNSQQGRELSHGRTFAVKVYQGMMRWLCWNFSNRRCGCSELAMNFLFSNKWNNDFYSRIIHNGIDFDEYKKSLQIDVKKREIGLTNKYNICTVGRISFQKNPEFLLDIFAAVVKLRDDVDLVWCGEGDMEDIIRKKIFEYKLNNRVHLLGTRKDVSDILRCSDVFLLPSRFEGLGIVLIEAQAANLHCVMSDVVPTETDCGLCIRLPLSIEAEVWARQISDILDRKIRLKTNFNKLNEYSIEHMVKEMEEVFEG